MKPLDQCHLYAFVDAAYPRLRMDAPGLKTSVPLPKSSVFEVNHDDRGPNQEDRGLNLTVPSLRIDDSLRRTAAPSGWQGHPPN